MAGGIVKTPELAPVSSLAILFPICYVIVFVSGRVDGHGRSPSR